MKKFIRYTLLILLTAVLAFLSFAYVRFTPIMAGMAAKTMCSCVHVMGRTPESVKEKELSVFPGLSSAEFTFQDSSSVTASIAGFSKTAIFRKGLGCTLLAQRKEAEIRDQAWKTAVAPQLDSLPWPMGDVLPNDTIAGVDYNKLHSALEEAFQETNPEKPKNTLAIVVVYNGRLVAEKYAPGVTMHSPLMGWSMTKSITNALVGIRVKDGALRTDKPAPVKEWSDDDRRNITLNDLMQASSGLEWNESYFLPGDFHNMFMFSDDKGGYAASKPAENPPGTFWEYSSGTTNLLSRIVRQSMPDSVYHRFPYERLLHRIGMTHTLIEPDASGTFVGSSYGYASARDWARFGLLFLQDGIWNGERILPEGWVTYSSTPAKAAPMGEYGAQWWLNAGAPGNPEKCFHPGLPHDLYSAEGFEQQLVWIIPSRKLVLVRLGVSHHGFDDAGLATKVLEALPADQ